MITFGKYRGQDPKVVPQEYLEWVLENISKEEMRKPFEEELKRRTKPEQHSKEYNKLIFGKNTTEKIVNITIEDDVAYIYKNDGSCEVIEYRPWALSKDPYNGSVRLQGNQYYKYITEMPKTRFLELKREFKRGVWLPRSIEETIMLRDGYTYFKGLKVNDVSVLSFDIEATGLDSNAENAEVILISYTFRNRFGITEKKIYDIFDYKNQTDMIKDFSAKIQQLNPDILIGHNIFGYDLQYMHTQCPLEIGRDGSVIQFDEKPSKIRKDGSQQYDFFNAKVHGREIVDTMFLALKYDIGRDFPSYGLKQIEKHLNLVDANRIEWDFSKYPTHSYKTWPKEVWVDFKKYISDDSDSPLKMFDIMIPSFFYLNQSIPKTLQQIINEASGSQLDSLMIRAYLQEGYSQPLTSQKVEFEGAISMGVPGVYENVRKVDVASLYPSIMLEYDIYDKVKDPNRYMLQALEYFRNERLTNKKLAKETGESYYDDLQSAQKIMINSMYGFLGASYLLYNYPQGAADVTRHGRDILQIGVKWATGHELEKVVKLIRNQGKENEETSYEWVVGKKVTQGKGYQLVNVDTDSFSYTDGTKPNNEFFNNEIKELNSLYPKLISWEKDGKTGIFDKIIVVKAKNYVLVENGKIKYKGSSLTDQKKEPILIQYLEDNIQLLLDGKNLEDINLLYKKYCLEALNPKDVKQWCVKKTVTKSVLNAERLNEEKVFEACQQAIKAGVIGSIQEGDKVYLYQALDGMKQKMAKGKPVFNKKGEPTLIENAILKFPELYNNDFDTWHYVSRVYSTLNILSNLVDMSKLTKYHLKSNQKKLKT